MRSFLCELITIISCGNIFSEQDATSLSTIKKNKNLCTKKQTEQTKAKWSQIFIFYNNGRTIRDNKKKWDKEEEGGEEVINGKGEME